jgi:hypothetical protein
MLHDKLAWILTSNTLQTYTRIANPNWIFHRSHLRPELALPVEMELLHDAIIGCLQHLDLRTTQMVARREMCSCSAAKRQHLDACIVCSGDDMCCEILNGSGLEAGQ